MAVGVGFVLLGYEWQEEGALIGREREGGGRMRRGEHSVAGSRGHALIDVCASVPLRCVCISVCACYTGVLIAWIFYGCG